MRIGNPSRESGWERIAHAAIALAVLAVVEMVAYAPSRDLASFRVWSLQAGGTLLLIGATFLLGEMLRRILAVPGSRRVSGAEVNLAIAILLVAVVHSWTLVQSRWEQLQPWAPSWVHLGSFTCALAIGYALARELSRRAGLDRLRFLVIVVASLATLIGVGGAIRDAVGANALAHLRMPILLSGGTVFVATVAIGLLLRRRHPMLIGLPAISGLLVMRALAGDADGWIELAPGPGARAGGPPVVFVVLDTFRSDALDLRDPAVSDTPNLASLAGVADVSPNAVANGSWTLPGHASLFTGLTLSRHRTDRTLEPAFSTFLPPELPTSHELFAQHGYRTSCIVANGIVGMGSQLARGCQRYRNPSRHWLTNLSLLGLVNLATESRFAMQQLLLEATGIDFNAGGHEIVDLALRELGDEPRGTYLLLNFLDVHGPIFGVDAQMGPSLRSRLLMRWDLIRRTLGLIGEDELWNRHRDTLRAYYDAEVRELDAELGTLFAALEERGWFDEALLVVTSDHGEAFSENAKLPSYFSHHSAYEPAVRIPLIVKRPGQREGSRPVRLIQQVDVLPTLLEVAGLPRVQGLDGRSLNAPAPGPAITEWYRRSPDEGFPYLPHNRIGVYHGPFKYVVEGDGAEYLYDLERSPFEGVDVLREHPELAARLRSTVEAVIRRSESNPARSEAPIDPGLMDQLRALGYAK
jgi:arylsulfatase A-like enzyme